MKKYNLNSPKKVLEEIKPHWNKFLIKYFLL